MTAILDTVDAFPAVFAAIAAKDGGADPNAVETGPARASLARKYPQAAFLGSRQGEALAEAYAGADVFVFPSKTDTFGLVLLEALASGVPVGALNDDLRAACLAALNISPQSCLEFAAGYTWEASARAFIDNMADIRTADATSDQMPFAAEHPSLVA
jgi:glycosyltransferase involved in cell wall biosynthesis